MTISYHIHNTLPPTYQSDVDLTVPFTDTVKMLAQFPIEEDMNSLRDLALAPFSQEGTRGRPLSSTLTISNLETVNGAYTFTTERSGQRDPARQCNSDGQQGGG